MARVTVEDCIDKIPNRYELLMVAAQRAKDIASGAPITVARDNDKNTVVALREIADETISIEELQKSLVMGLQKYVEVEEPEEEELEIMAAEKELSDLDEQFSGLVLENDLGDNMQVRGEDDDIDLDAEVENETGVDLDDEGRPLRWRVENSWGKDAAEAVHNAVVLEQVAKMAYIAYGVNPSLTMNPLLVEKHFSRKHGPGAYYGQAKNEDHK